MKVLMVDVNYNFSSTGKIVHDLTAQLRMEGHVVEASYGRGKETNEAGLFKIASGVEVVLDATLSRISGMVGYFSPLATRRLIAQVERFNPDVVHLHELHGYYVNIFDFINYLKCKGIKVVWTFHCEFMYTGRCGYANECEKWKDTCHSCPQLSEYPKSLLFDFSEKMHLEKKELFEGFENLVIVAPSNWLARRISESFLVNKRIQVINNGIDTDVFKPTEFEFLKIRHSLSDEFVAISVAPDLMSDRKGGKWVVELAERYLGENIKFILIGVTVLEAVWPDNVIALPLLTSQYELAAYYSMADITILSSRKETFSMVTAESLACGTPILGFDSGAPPEVAPSGYGYFVEYGDLNALGSMLMDFVNGKPLYSSEDACVEFSSSNYSKRKMFSSYTSLYLESVNGR